MFVTQKKSKKEKEKKRKEIPRPADLVFLGDFTTWIMGEKRSRITGDRITGELRS